MFEESMFENHAAELPPQVDTMEPGPMLAVILATIDVGALSGHDRVVVLRAQQRMASHYQARAYEAMAAVTDALREVDDDPSWAAEAAAAEIRVALRLTRRAADCELELALNLHERLPRVAEMLAAGQLDLRRVKTIVYGTDHLSPALARRVVEEVLGEAAHLTTGQLAALIRRTCVEVEPDEAARRYADAVDERRVVVEATSDGTAHLMGLDLPPHRVAAAARHINRLARSLRCRGETRTMDQLRADVLVDLLSGKGVDRRVAAPDAMVDLRVDLSTLARLDERAGDVAGYGPVIADIARQVTVAQQAAEWRFTVTDPDHGRVLVSGVTRQRPSVAQRRTVQARDPSCVFPGCRMPAVSCDLDHRIPCAKRGPTVVANLAPLCRHDHRIRHQAGWSHHALPDGDHEWRTALGHRYTTSGRPP